VQPIGRLQGEQGDFLPWWLWAAEQIRRAARSVQPVGRLQGEQGDFLLWWLWAAAPNVQPYGGATDGNLAREQGVFLPWWL